MRTPAGSECPYYYQDFHRGHNRQECRLIDATPDGGTYTPDLCTNCPVPRIVLANACPNMILEGRVKSLLLGLRKNVDVSVFCRRTERTGFQPEIGCGECHLEFPEFTIFEDSE